MAEISIWKVIKACIIILLLLIVVKKILKVWREHRRERKLIDDAAYRNQIHQQQLATAQMHRDNFAAVTAPVTGVATAAMASPAYVNPAPMYGGADDFEDPDFEQIEAYEEESEEESDSEEEYESEEETMTGGSFFDILSKIKSKPKKKKAASKAKPKKKATTKAKPKSKAKKTSSKKKGKK